MREPICDGRVAEKTKVATSRQRMCRFGVKFSASLVQVDFLLTKFQGGSGGTVCDLKLIQRHAQNGPVKRCSFVD
jgi:hypothetical protein